MPAQVRIFATPKSLGETLAAPVSSQAIPRSVPELPDAPRTVVTQKDIANVARSETNRTSGSTAINGTNGTPKAEEAPETAVREASRTNGSAVRRPPVKMEDTHKGGITFASQDKLPRLPIPDLSETCKKYLAALKPLQTHREHAETRMAANEFLKQDGPELQEKLKKYAARKSSYIEQFCKFAGQIKDFPYKG